MAQPPISLTPGEFLTIIAILLGGIYFLWNKLDQIWKAIGNSVTHEICHERRKECPCIKELKEVKEQLKGK